MSVGPRLAQNSRQLPESIPPIEKKPRSRKRRTMSPNMANSESWSSARLEWRLAHVYRVRQPKTCLCGHTPIIEICVLENQLNGRIAEVGNVCVNNFMGLESKKVFDCIKRISSDLDKAPNPATVELFYEQGLLRHKDRAFALDTALKRDLSPKQLAWRHDINRRILARVAQAEI